MPLTRLLPLLLCLMTNLAYAKDLDAKQLYARAKPALCMVIALDERDRRIGFGSGFLVSRSGHIITNAHVIERAERVVVDCNGKKSAVSAVWSRDVALDLVKLKSTVAIDTPLTIANHPTQAAGSVVFVLGNPHGLSATITPGIISGIRQFDGTQFIQLSASINPGNSGGPVINTQGQVIGIATRKLLGAEGIGFALPAHHVKQLNAVYRARDEIIGGTESNEVSVASSVPGNFRFRDIPFGIHCKQLDEQGLLLSYSALDASSEQLLSGAQRSLLGVETNIYYKCKQGVFVEGMYSLMPNQVDSVIAALRKKYGNNQLKQLGVNSKAYIWKPSDGYEIKLVDTRRSYLLKYTSHRLINWIDRVQQLKAIENGDL